MCEKSGTIQHAWGEKKKLTRGGWKQGIQYLESNIGIYDVGPHMREVDKVKKERGQLSGI